MTQSPSRTWIRPTLVSIIYLCLTLSYGVLNPLFEAPDEHHHYFTTEYIATYYKLPPTTDAWVRQEAAQPPLYYLVGALLIAPIDTSGSREQVWLNPQASIGDASALTNINWAIHTAQEAWPWHGYALAAHVLRIWSTLLGLGTLVCVYGSGRLLWPQHQEWALTGMALVAFLPQFDFLHASITNDTLITFLSAAAIWQILYLLHTSYPISATRYLLLGVTIGLAILTKNAGALLLLYSIGVVSLQCVQARRSNGCPLRQLITRLLSLIVTAVLIAGWLWWRNWHLYGDITATNQFIRLAGGDRGYTIWQVWRESAGLWTSLFAAFGWFNLRPPYWVYWIWNGIILMSIVGTAGSYLRYYLAQRHGETEKKNAVNITGKHLLIPLLFAWVLLVYAGLVTFMLKTEAAQGRLLFPALVPLTLAVVSGLRLWSSRFVPFLATLLALMTTLFCLLFVITPAYARPKIMTALPAEAARFDAPLEQSLLLVGAQMETLHAHPGDPVWLTLYWQTDSPPAVPPRFTLALIGRDQQVVAQVDSYHGRGLYPANLWPPGAIIADRFAIRATKTAVLPVLAQAYVGLVDAETRVHVGSVEVEPVQWPQLQGKDMVQVGEDIAITAVSLTSTTAHPGDAIRIDVQWHITAVPDTDYTTLIHLGDAGQPPLVTGDQQPVQGQYPTHLWASGEAIDDQYTLLLPSDLASGRYPVWIGMYDAQTFTRLPVWFNGERQPNDVYLVGWVDIREP